MAAIVVPLAIGYLVRSGIFAPGLILIGVLGVTGAFSYLFIVGNVERIDTKNADGKINHKL